MFDVMVDLETMGTRPGDAVISIGACAFDKTGILSEWYTAISPADLKSQGFKAQRSTMEWWQKQTPEAREAAFSGTLSVESALKQFQMWLPNPDKVRVWGNGASFDNAVLAAAYNQMKMDIPWKFWNDRCFRTVKNLFPLGTDPLFEGVKHNALADAKHQANWLIEIAKNHEFKLA